jgi:photosystem II stability/assembly factor-like uncharacterized protein
MKNLSTIVIGTLIIFFGINLSAQNISPLINLDTKENPKFKDVKNAYEEYWKDIPMDQRKGWKQFKRWEYFWESRLLDDGSFPDANKIYNEMNKFRSDDKKNYIQAAKNWTLLGPTTITGSTSQTGLGRINVVRFRPKSDKIIWIGAAGGGLWKSTNDGATWTNDPFFDFLSIGISDITFSESNPNIIYVATGDADGLGAGQSTYSIGIVKSTDGGITWKNTGLTYTLGKYIISRILVNRTNPNIVIAATNNGIYKSTDGGDNWIIKQGSAYFKDMEFSEDDDKIIVACTYGSWAGNSTIYHSSDQGETWKSVKPLTSCIRISLATAPSNEDVFYALAASTNRGFHSVLKSTDKGLTWTTKSDKTKNLLGWNDGSDMNRGQGEYDLTIAVNPGDENEIYTGGVNIWKSDNSGATWTQLTHWYGNYNKPTVHADIHDLQFNQQTGILYVGHDGGIDRTTNLGVSWKPIMDGLSITQFYKLSTAQTKDYFLYAGAQDNGTYRYEDGKWTYASGGDGMDCLVDYTDTKRAYVSTPYGDFNKTSNGSSFSNMVSSSNTGESGDWLAPITIDPKRPNILYTGFKSVWRSDNYGSSWRKYSTFSNGNVLKVLKVAPSDTNVMYAASTSSLWATYDAGKTWKSIGSTSISYYRDLTVDYNDPKRIFVVNGGFSDGSKIFEYDGTTWKNISTNLPNVPTNCIIFQKNSPDRLYVGTDVGVFYSDYGHANWEQYGDNVKNIVFTDLEIQENLKKLRGSTYGRGIWEIELIDCNLTEPIVKTIGETSFCNGDSVILESVNEQPNYKWSNGMEGKRIVIKESGTYALYFEDGLGCKSRSKGVTVVVTTPPALAVSTGNAQLCPNGTLDLSASFGFATYTWSTGATGRKITINKPGKYWVSGSTKEGCSITSKEIEVQLLPEPEKPMIIRYNAKQLISSQAKAYQWYCNDTLLAGFTERVCEIVKLGKFTVEITNDIGCKAKSDFINVVSDVNDDFSINEYQRITPNPTSGIFNLEMKLRINTEFEMVISNPLGEKVYSVNGNYTGGEFTKSFDISHLANGLYIVQIKTKNDTFMERLIKQ